jgi:hypothetical protein
MAVEEEVRQLKERKIRKATSRTNLPQTRDPTAATSRNENLVKAQTGPSIVHQKLHQVRAE